ncbi:MAG: indolepyruvate ferredoxin oxidoreductase subunit alpha [Thermoplasmata archaeon]
MSELIKAKKGDRILALGNEAICRGAFEAGIEVAATYPGTPASEIGDTFSEIAKEGGFYFEYSPNEMVAFEVSAAASAAGNRSIVSMKHVGLNVAADAFMTLAYIGVKGGHLTVVADDPGCHSSQNEQDTRIYSMLANIPCLEPSNVQECLEMTRESFELSEKLQMPFLLRPTTRVSHVRGVITCGDVSPPKKVRHFDKEPSRWVPVPANARNLHKRNLEKEKDAREMAENSRFNYIVGPKEARLGVIASGVAATYVQEALDELYECGILKPDKNGDRASAIKLLKLGWTHPLPEKLIKEFLQDCDKVLVAEEMEPYLEHGAKRIAFDNGFKVEILGKDSGHFERWGEYNPERVESALEKAFGVRPIRKKALEPLPEQMPSRPPVLCPACPHRSTYYAAKKAVKTDKGKEWVYTTDIGCYTLGLAPPYQMADFLLCMGSSIGTVGGFAKGTDQKVMAFVGDSTFFHNGIHGLINAVYNKHDVVYVVLDNSTTAMTGHQPHPGIGVTGMGEKVSPVSVEEVVKGVGVKFVKTVDPYDIKATEAVFKEAVGQPGVRVIIAKHPCALIEYRERRKAKADLTPYVVNHDVCRKCGICYKQFACPAAYITASGKPQINPAICYACGECAQVCPFGAIVKKEVA